MAFDRNNTLDNFVSESAPKSHKKTDDPDYGRKYYLRNRDRIAARKKEKYATDAEYRRAIKERTERSNYLKSKAGRAPKKRKRRRVAEDDPMRPTKFTIYVGTERVVVNMYTARQLGYLIDKSNQTIRLWESKGWLPAAMYKSTSGDRLYTEFQVTSIYRIYSKVVETLLKDNPLMSIRVMRLGETEFPKLVKDVWENYPIGVDV